MIRDDSTSDAVNHMADTTISHQLGRIMHIKMDKNYCLVGVCKKKKDTSERSPPKKKQYVIIYTKHARLSIMFHVYTLPLMGFSSA